MDVEVFAENIASMRYKVEHLLEYYRKNKEPKYIVFTINGAPISGYKYYFKSDDIFFDFTVYKKNSKEILLRQRHIDSNLSFGLTVLLRIIKYLHYYLNLINKPYYSYFKKKLWFFHNSEKTISISYNKEKYSQYIQTEINKDYLIDYLVDM